MEGWTECLGSDQTWMGAEDSTNHRGARTPLFLNREKLAAQLGPPGWKETRFESLRKGQSDQGFRIQMWRQWGRRDSAWPRADS